MSLVEIRFIAPRMEDFVRQVKAENITPDKVERIARLLALEAERAMKTELSNYVRTGLTRASIESWPLTITPVMAAYAVGSRTRGHILYWLDRGRGWVFPVKRRALRWIGRGGEVVFSRYSRPSQPQFIFEKVRAWVQSQVDKIVSEVLAT